MLRKRWMAVILAAVMVFGMAAPSFAADVATPAQVNRVEQVEVASSSNAVSECPMEEYVEADMFDVIERPILMNAGELDEFESTVPASYLSLGVGYSDMSGIVKYVHKPFDSRYYASLALPSDCAFVNQFFISISKSGLPSSGRYRIKVRFSSNTGVEYSGGYFWTQKTNTNAAVQSSSHLIDVSQVSGDWNVSDVIDLGGAQQLDIGVYPKSGTTAILPYGGYVSVYFEKTTETPSYTGAGGSYTPDNAATDTALNTSKMADTLEEIVGTISNQLEALWDQMFNLMHVPQLANDDKNTGLITGAIEEQVEADRQNTEDIIAAEEANTTTIVNNNNENTEKITNGYDSAGMEQQNDRLSDTLQGLDEQESQIVDQISQPLNDFKFDNPVTQYLDTFKVFGNFLQSLFVSSGSFQDVINLSFVLGIALMVVGIYRFKGGS